MKILISGINYAPEPTGIAVYTTGMAEWLAERGHDVRVVCAPPHYPDWRIPEEYRRAWYHSEQANSVRVLRCPTYVPARPSGAKRILHYLSYCATSFIPTLFWSARWRPDVMFAIAPSLLGAGAARLASGLSGTKATWLHVQDFEVEAAFATGMLAPEGTSGRFAKWLERKALGSFGRVSAISTQMCRKLREKGVAQERIYEFRNWADIGRSAAGDDPSPYRAEWNIATPNVALYSGSIGNKQGIEIVIEAARALRDRSDLTFVICGNGPNRDALEQQAKGLPNLQFRDLQPRERLGELMNLATIHLLPQIADAADLVLPSKLTNMLASGKPVIATANPGTGLALEVEGCGIVTPPEDHIAFALAIERVANDPALRQFLGSKAQVQANTKLARGAILLALERQISVVFSNAA